MCGKWSVGPLYCCFQWLGNGNPPVFLASPKNRRISCVSIELFDTEICLREAGAPKLNDLASRSDLDQPSRSRAY